MHPRGRSTNVSPVAIARQASQERRNRTSIMSCYPLPTDPEKHPFYYLSPPSPSSSLATSPPTLTPPDPAPLCLPRTRIVQDTSHAPIDPRESPFPSQVFNPQHLPYPLESRLSSPLPSYPLVEKATFQVDAGQRAREQARAKCRYETLARAEQVFSTILERSRRERLAALLLRTRQEDEVNKRERVTRELERLEHERDRRRSVNHISHVQRSGFRVLARVPPPVATSQPQQRQVPDRFTYTFPLLSTSPTNPAPMRQQSGSVRTRLGLPALTNPNATNTRSVSFDDIRASMGNVLFPIAHGESASGKTRRESELLGTLLDPVRWEEGERWHPRGRVNAWAPQVPETVTGCGACESASLSLDSCSAPFPQTPSSSSGIASTSTSVPSRPISWLSFGSRKSTSSITTTHPTPASTVDYSPCTSGRPTPQHPCGCTRQSFEAVDVNDSPLGSSVKRLPMLAQSAASVNTHQEPARRRPRKISFSARTWFAMHSSVASVLSVAARFQYAYATGATFTATDYTQDVPTLIRSSSETGSGYARRLPSGWRASRSDVAKFTSTASHVDWEAAVPYLICHLVELKSIHRFPPSTSELPSNQPAQDSIPPHSPSFSSVAIPPTYHDADRHIFNANPLHLLSRAQINSWRFRGAPGDMPPQVFCRPELFYRIEPAGSSLRESNSGSALKWGWRVVWDTDDHGQC